MRNPKLLWGLIGCLILLLAIFGWNYGELIGSRKVATVGDVTITEADWTRELKGTYGTTVLEKMINREVVDQEAKKYGISISDEEIEAEWMKLQSHGSSTEQEWAGEELKGEIRHYLLLEKIATMDIEIPEQELYRYYEENRQKYNQPPLARISAIYVHTKKEAEQVVSELKNGSDFQTLAKEKSTEIYSAASGGDLGWVSLLGGDVEQEIIDQALLLSIEQISEPIPLEKGFAIIKVQEKKEAVTRGFEDVKLEIRREVALSQVGSLDQVLDRMKKGIGVQVFGVQ